MKQAMATASNRDILQPSLLDRLTDDHPDKTLESREQRAMTKSRMRAAVLRDLAWLFNATRQSSDVDWAPFPHAERSVINFGLPALSGKTASSMDIRELEQMVRQAIIDHEPRITPETLQVEATSAAPLLEQHNLLSFRITGQLWSQPLPIEMMLQTDIDLESGHVRLQDLSR